MENGEPEAFVTPWRCYQCKQQFDTKNEFDKHNSDRHSGDKYICPVCKSHFRFASDLGIHIEKREATEDDTESHVNERMITGESRPVAKRKDDFVTGGTVNENGVQHIHIKATKELFTAGTDTSTSTIEWAMAELVKNPESMMKVREELGREVNQDLPKESHLMQLPYLQACIKETFRLHPPAPLLLPHRAPEACQVMNYTIPKNAQVLVNVWAIGRDPGIWDEPLKFKPERFLSCSLDYKGNDFELLPFGSGRRICPGLPMAARHVPLVLASLIHCFDWSLPEGKDPQQLDMNEKFGVTLEKEQPLLLIPKARS